jgi:hypothetical protein
VNPLRWLRGEFSTKTKARQALGVRNIIGGQDLYEGLKLMAALAKLAGYAGLLVVSTRWLTSMNSRKSRQLLAPVHHVDRVVDVQHHGGGWPGAAGTVEIHHGPHQPDRLAQGGRVLPARDGRLRAEVPSAVGPVSCSCLAAARSR